MATGSSNPNVSGLETRIAAAGSRLNKGAQWVLNRPPALLALVMAVGVLIRLYRFGAPILDQHAFRQTQTASTVWLWNRDGFDFLDYHVPMFGGGNWVLELPTYQALVWMLQVPLGGIESAARIVSIASYVAVAVLMYLIATRWLGSRAAALFGVAIFTFLPVTVFFFRAVLIDTLLIATTLLAIYAATLLAERFTWPWFGVFSLALVVSALGKATLVLALGLAIVVLAIRILLDRRVTTVAKAALVGVGALTSILSLLWTRHADALNLASGALSFSDGRDWYFGSTFTDPELFRIVGQRFLDNFGPIGLVLVGIGLAAIPSLGTRYRPELAATLLGGFLSVGIFANLNRVHDYYQLAYYVTLSMLAGLGVAVVYRALGGGSAPSARSVAAGVIIALALSWSISTWNTYFAPAAVAYSIQGQGLEMRAATPDAPLIVVQEAGDKNEPMLWYEARRIGWRVPTGDEAQARRIARATPDLGGVVFLRGASPEPPYVEEIAFARGFQRTFESPAMVVYTAPR